MQVIICTFFLVLLLYLSYASDLLSVLWETDEDYAPEEDLLVMKSLEGVPLGLSENAKIIRRLSHLPFTDHLKTLAWYKLLRNRDIKKMDVMSWRVYEPLIPYLPPSFIQEVNLSDQDVLTYFGLQEFKEDQLYHLAEEVTQDIGSVLGNEKKIMMLGNIFCGFPTKELSNINDHVWRGLFHKDFFRVLSSCSQEHLSAMVRILMQNRILGPPRTWKPLTVRQVGSLIAGLNDRELREIQAESFSEVTPRAVKLIPARALKQLSTAQVKNFDMVTLLSWRRKTQDLRDISEASYISLNASIVTGITAFLLARWWVYSLTNCTAKALRSWRVVFAPCKGGEGPDYFTEEELQFHFKKKSTSRDGATFFHSAHLVVQNS